ncbi:transglutaminase-like putative cysteine protease [Arthrobacter pigmenti]|uniref:Transglutaminase-like putative cysteine protease n=1 Tax=Arthrobacter pigmenti TaxID=271432 RepID=A0A846RN70_9MICC|nr:DUF3488 and transglutaminase-like domain-containing protein [Arthrobacter pigmenti]NJC21764.1 transglutaminase-like putative cysteine protease [Arthrobacter pigmenti]
MTATLSRPATSGHTQRLTPARPDEPRRSYWHLLVSLASLIAVMLTSVSLSGVIFGGSWFTPVLVTVVTVLFFMALTRLARLPGVFAPLAGLLALGGSLIWQFFPGQSTFGVFPGPGFNGRLLVLLNHAENTVVSQVAPVLPGTGLFLVVCAGVGLIAILVDTLANTLRMPATSGLALLAILVVPAVVRINSVGVAAFIAAVVGFLILLGCAHWREARFESASSHELSGGHLSRGLVIGASALVLAVLLPLAIPGFNSGAFPQGARVNLWGTATGLNPIVTLGNDLRNPTGFGRIEYATNAEDPLYLRSVTLEDFSGQRWEPDQRMGQRVAGVEEMGSELQQDPNLESSLTRISTESFTSPWLLAPYAPVSISGLNGRWAWDPQNLSILAIDGGSTAQQDYLVRSAEPALTRERLQAIPPVDRESVPEQFLSLPEQTPGIIRDTTATVTEGIENPYSKAIAIQSYLRGPSFVYSVDAPVDGGYDGNSLEVMARFLESKSGYCVHYAGTMAVMARLAGIPSRVAVGYSPGTPTGEVVDQDGVELTQYSVNSKDAHAWPELYFEGVGWVQFEPTPSRGVVPDYALSAVAPVAPPVNDNLNPGAGPIAPSTATPTPAAEEEETAQAVRESTERSSTLGIILGSVLLILALTPLTLRLLRTARRRSTVTAGPDSSGRATAAWAQAVEISGDYGYAAAPTDTPRSFENRLLRQASLGKAAAGAVERLRRAYEEEEYSELRGPGAHSGTAWDDVETVTAALRDAASLPTRLQARFWPASLWQRFGAQRSEGARAAARAAGAGVRTG